MTKEEAVDLVVALCFKGVDEVTKYDGPDETHRLMKKAIEAMQLTNLLDKEGE